MGRSITPKYAMWINGNQYRAIAWNCREYGKPTAENIERWMTAYVKAQRPGGVNEHLSRITGKVDVPNSGVIVDQKNDMRVVATWKAPLFWAV